ncbi:MAG TPA: Crp/Fnr family transcriptional regulator [Ignavibacteriaceae bacterium]|nr:Crp/Fnr family transcriptional regulator [Ignavibacteriaceae bacterium]
MIPDKSAVRYIPMFSELSSDQLREVTTVSSLISFKKHQLLFMEGEEYRGFFILLKGNIKIFRINKEGKETILHLIKPKQAFADTPLFEGKSYPVSAEALEDCLLLFFNKEKFMTLLEKNPRISLRMLSGFSKRMRSLTLKVEELASMEVTSRLARFLIQEATANHTENLPKPFVKLNVSKTTIAGYLGTITETLSRTFKKLQDENIIIVKGRKIFIKNYKKLKLLAS